MCARMHGVCVCDRIPAASMQQVRWKDQRWGRRKEPRCCSPSICLSMHTFLFINCLSIYTFLYINRLSIYLSFYLCIYMFIYIHCPSIYLSMTNSLVTHREQIDKQSCCSLSDVVSETCLSAARPSGGNFAPC